jgi:hypothetical protein|tara:strand:+ start:928 stop:1125 length:198 start_codon:yes stop_codon:yes gene_type:complete
MNLEQIKKALEKGLKVYWENDGYEVLKDKLGRYLVVFRHNGYTVGLTDLNGNLQGNPNKFYVRSV